MSPGDSGCDANTTSLDKRCPSDIGRYFVPVLLGIYMLLTNVLLLNLLIAMFRSVFRFWFTMLFILSYKISKQNTNLVMFLMLTCIEKQVNPCTDTEYALLNESYMQSTCLKWWKLKYDTWGSSLCHGLRGILSSIMVFH